MGVCLCSMFCCTLRYVHSSFAIILIGKRELVTWLSLSSWCLIIVVWLFLAVLCVCLQFAIVVFRDHTHLLFYMYIYIITLTCLSLIKRVLHKEMLHSHPEINILTKRCHMVNSDATFLHKDV